MKILNIKNYYHISKKSAHRVHANNSVIKIKTRLNIMLQLHKMKVIIIIAG